MKRFLILLPLMIFTGMSVFGQLDLQSVAIVNLTRSEPITVRQLRAQCETLAWQNLTPQLGRIPTNAELTQVVQGFNTEQRRQILDAMINERLALQAAERDRVTVTDSELNQQIDQLRNQMAQALGRPPTESEFAQAIRNETGLEFPAFRDQIRRQTITQKYLMTTKEHLFNTIREPTDAEILSEYNAQLQRGNLVQPSTIRFQMIQVPFEQDEASRTRARELANRLSGEIGNDPARFDAVALRAQVPNSGYLSGDAGYVSLSDQTRAMLPDFYDVASTLRQGEVSRVIDSPQGYRIIKITENHNFKILEMNDIILDNNIIQQFGGLITVRQFLAQSLFMQQQQDVLSRATQELVTELRRGNPFQVMENNLSNW